MSDFDWFTGDSTSNAEDDPNSWEHLGKVVANHLGHGVVTGAGYAADILGHLIAPTVANTVQKPSDVVAGKGAVTEATDKAYKAIAGDVEPRTKGEQYAASISEGVGSAIAGGAEGGWASLARAAAAGAAAGGATQAVNDVAPGHPDLANIAGLAVGAIAGLHGGKVSGVRSGMEHPEFSDLADRVIPALEGGGTFEHPLTNHESGAMGPMQVTPETARDPGYGIKPWDGKTQEDLARVGREKFDAMLDKYDGDTSKALAAYNWGEGNVDHAVDVHGDNWLDYAPAETRKYVNKGMNMAYGGSPVHGGSTGEAVPPMDLPPVEETTALAEDANRLPDPDKGKVIDMNSEFNKRSVNAMYDKIAKFHDEVVFDDRPANIQRIEDLRSRILKGYEVFDEGTPEYSKIVDMDNMLASTIAHQGGTPRMYASDASDVHLGQEPLPVEPANDLGNKQETITRQLYTYLTGKDAPPYPSMSDMLGGARDKLAENSGLKRTNTDRAIESGWGSGKPPSNDLVERDQNPPAESSTFGTRLPETTARTEAPKSPEGHEPTSPEEDNGVSPRDKLIEALENATKKLPAQEELIASQRRERLAKVHQAAESQLTGTARSHAMLAALKGPMDRIDFDSIANDLSPEDLNSLHDEINNHPSLNGYERVAAINGLNKLTHPDGGTLPYKSEVDALNKVFPGITNTLKKSKSLWAKIKEGTAEVANLSRALITTLDLSAPFTQASALVGEKEFWTNMPNMVKAMVSKEFHESMWHEMQRDPYFKYAQRGHVSFTHVDGPLSGREEAFMSRLAEKIPVIGIFVRASNRAYVTYLNKLRFDVFKRMMKDQKDLGVNVKDQKFLNDLGGFINNATGRGNLGKYNSSAPLLNAAFFSPRMQMSRATLLNPIYYMRLHPAVRVQAIKTMLKFSGIMAVTLGLAYLGGARVSMNIDDPDFLKIRIGDTRIGNFGAFGPWIRIGYKVVTGLYHSAKGDKTKYNVGDDIMHFARTKLSPVAGALTDIAQGGKQVTGVKIKDERFLGLKGASAYIIKRYVPMVLQDTQDAVRSAGIKGVGVAPLAVVGIPIQTYKDRPKKSTGKSQWDYAFGGGDNPWDYAFKGGSS